MAVTYEYLKKWIPCDDMPKVYPYRACSYKWWGKDSEECLREYGGHPLYGPDDISYDLNSYGFRCPEFSCQAELRVVSLGCSYVFGQGLPRGETFHERVCEELRMRLGKTIVNWNLGSTGLGNDTISRLLYLAVPVLKPDLIMINFTHTARKEYFLDNERECTYNPSFAPTDPTVRELYGHFSSLSNETDEAVNFFRIYKGIEAFLAGRNWLFSLTEPEAARALSGHLNGERFAGVLAILDRARDHSHPGRESHQALADAYLRKINDHNWFPAAAF